MMEDTAPKFTIERVTVEAQTRKLNMTWTVEEAEWEGRIPYGPDEDEE